MASRTACNFKIATLQRRFWQAAFVVFAFTAAIPQAIAQATDASENFTGVWKGSRTFGEFSTEVTFDLRQSGNRIAGSAVWALSPSGLGGTGGDLEGVQMGNRMTFRVPSSQFTGEATLAGDEVRGVLIGPYEYVLVLRRVK
jgi:hypothetical protein